MRCMARSKRCNHRARYFSYLCAAAAGDALKVCQQVLGQRRDHLIRQRVPRAEFLRSSLPAAALCAQNLSLGFLH